ncbi:hypothetical protein BGZ83_000368 [Gryganskiella cystojenkinii]|nr:hypothetical protein BGZ83_000368 [Gryganskiella cystojenkinii]
MPSSPTVAVLIREFFNSAEQKFAVVGASTNRAKFGNKILRWQVYIDNGYKAVPVNPRESIIEGQACVTSLSKLPGDPSEYHVSIITPPAATKSVLEEAHQIGISRVWLQPGAESAEAIAFARQNGLKILAEGPCVLENGIPASDL